MNTSSTPTNRYVEHVSRASELLAGIRALSAEDDVPDHLRDGLVAAASKLIDALNRRTPLDPAPRDLDDVRLMMAIATAREVESSARQETDLLMREARRRAITERRTDDEE